MTITHPVTCHHLLPPPGSRAPEDLKRCRWTHRNDTNQVFWNMQDHGTKLIFIYFYLIVCQLGSPFWGSLINWNDDRASLAPKTRGKKETNINKHLQPCYNLPRFQVAGMIGSEISKPIFRTLFMTAFFPGPALFSAPQATKNESRSPHLHILMTNASSFTLTVI